MRPIVSRSRKPQTMNEISKRILFHAAAAGAFFFVLQHYVLHESLRTSALWAVAFALAAGGFAWSQQRR
jgi:hypothetical protein